MTVSSGVPGKSDPFVPRLGSAYLAALERVKSHK